MTFGFGFCSVLSITWVLVGFVVAGFGFVPISVLVGDEFRCVPASGCGTDWATVA